MSSQLRARQTISYCESTTKQTKEKVLHYKIYFMKIGIIYMIINECLFYFTNVSDACWGFILHVNFILDTVTRVIYAWALKTNKDHADMYLISIEITFL